MSSGKGLSSQKQQGEKEVNFAFNLEIKVWSLEEERRGTESMLLEYECVQCEVSKVSDDFQVVCWPWYYCAWLASQHAWPEPQMESMGYFQEKYEKQSIQQ